VLKTLRQNDRYKSIDVEKAITLCRASMTASSKAAIETVASGTCITKELLLGIGGTPRDLRSAGWYGIVISDEEDASYLRAYVGQAESVGHRLQQHTDAAREDPNTGRHQSLLYHIWRKPGRRAIFVHLGVLKGYQKDNETHQLTLNIGEQLFAEALQTLQVHTMRRILPGADLTTPALGLNVALPIDQPSRSGSRASNGVVNIAAQREFAALSHSTDTEVLEYYNDRHHQFTREQQEKGRQSMMESQHAQQIHGARQGRQNKTADLQRGPACKEEERVEVFCMKCKSDSSRHVDPAPLYEIATNQYVARRAPCPTCPGPSTTKKAREVMIPYDRALGFVRWNWVGKEIDRKDPRWAHKR
jgi:hypothetical protein